jgi:hypothetical protein
MGTDADAEAGMKQRICSASGSAATSPSTTPTQSPLHTPITSPGRAGHRLEPWSDAIATTSIWKTSRDSAISGICPL